MTDPVPLAAVLRLRNRAYHREPGLRLRSAADALNFVRRVGFCLFWPTRGLEAPTLLHAAAGRALPLGGGYGHSAFGKTWNWKDEALDKRRWYYGRLLRGRATLVSLELLPAFYALSENYGDPGEYLLQYQDGRLSAEAKSVYEALLEWGPLDTVRLRKESRLAGTTAKARFQRALGDLQEGLKILPTGVAEAGAWNYAFIYDLVSRWLPDLEGQARRITTGEARREILLQHLENLAAASESEIRKLLGWPPALLGRTISGLSEAGDLTTIEVRDRGQVHVLLATRAGARRLRKEVGTRRSIPVARKGREIRSRRRT